MQKKVIFQTLAAAALFFFSGHAGHAAKASLPVLKVGSEGAYMPFNYLDEKGNVQGFDIEISKAICAEINMKCEFVTQEWNGIIPGLLAKRYDAIVAGMAATDERRKQVDFTDTYFKSPVYLVGKKGTKIENFTTDLKGLKIGVQRGTTHANFAVSKFKNSTVKQYDNQEAANLDLKSKRLDLVLAESAVMSFWMDKNGEDQFSFVGPQLDVGEDAKIFGEGANIALRKDSTDLKSKINKALAALKANGKYDKIKAQFFGSIPQ